MFPTPCQPIAVIMRSNNDHLGNGGVPHQEEDGQEPDIDLDVPLDDGGVQGRDDTGTVRFIYIS